MASKVEEAAKEIRTYVAELERERDYARRCLLQMQNAAMDITGKYDKLRSRIESAPRWHVFRSKSGALSCKPTDDCEWQRHSIYAVPVEDEKQEGK